MRRSHRLPALVLAVAGAFTGASAQAQPAPPPKPAHADATAACERAARQSIAPQAAQVPDITFDAAPAIDAGLSGDSQVVLRGSGHWRGANGPRTFSYSCNVDLRNPDSVGLVMRDLTPPGQTPAARALPEPDLSHLSPAACESSAATALKQRWPRVSQISFDGNTRSLEQDSPSRGALHGQGHALPAPDAPQTHFGFDCEFDPRDGRVLATRISG